MQVFKQRKAWVLHFLSTQYKIAWNTKTLRTEKLSFDGNTYDAL